jgi:hypothetical protein
MTQKDFRAKLSPAEFDAIAFDEEHPIDNYYFGLVDGNPQFFGIREEFPQGYEDISLIRQLTPGQQLLILLGVFDGQVCNGGITQFFWNYPEYLFDVRDAIERLGDANLLKHYERVLEGLVGKKRDWNELRQECDSAKDGPSWESFRKSYDLLDLGWFDNAYFDERGYNDKKEWVKLKRGLQHPFLKRLAEYVRSHRSEFIQE